MSSFLPGNCVDRKWKSWVKALKTGDSPSRRRGVDVENDLKTQNLEVSSRYGY
jgi:hypothetical protein